MKRKLSYTLLFLVLLPIFSLLYGCGKNVTPVSQTAYYFDTVVTITLYRDGTLSRTEEETVFDGCFSLCETYEAMLSRTREGSDVWRINHADGAPTRVSPETAALLRQALSFCEATGGALDITVAPLSDLWDFSSQSLQREPDDGHRVPSQDEIEACLSHVDYKNVLVEGDTVTLADPGAAIDLGCIAKGYIADQLKQYLQQQGCTSAIIDLGGNLLTLGAKPDGAAYSLGIQRPFDLSGTPIATLSVTDTSLVSSGVYERYFDEDGVRYHHLLNAKTGMPEDNGLLSVTILSPSSAQGDALSTACFLLGPQAGMDYVESLPDVEAVFITQDYALHPSSGLSSLLRTQ